jgi:hypothetical protein
MDVLFGLIAIALVVWIFGGVLLAFFRTAREIVRYALSFARPVDERPWTPAETEIYDRRTDRREDWQE